MALTASDWTITRSTGVIAYTGDDHGGASPSYATVIEFHRWVQGLADDAIASGDDELDITNTDPSRRSTDNIITLINGYTIGDTEAEHLYDGSIIYNDGDEIYDGIVNFGNAAVQIQLIQNGSVLADDWWNFNSAGLNADSNAGISHRFMIKTRSNGADIDGRRLIGTCRRFLYTYSEFSINGTSRGNNVLALTDALDLNNETAAATVLGWTGITNTEGYRNIDVDNNSVDEHYYSEWNTNQPTRDINEFYERMKWLSRDGSSSSLYGLNGELFRGITHQVAITGPAGTFVEPELVSWGSLGTSGTGQLLAIDSVTAGTKMWIQILTGVIPAANTITGNGGGTATASTITERTISKPFCGASTGSAIIGAYGLGIETTDLSATDKVFDLTNTQRLPPNNVTNTVGGLVNGEDRVLVGPWDGASTDVNGDPAINKNQLKVCTALTTDNVTSIVVSAGDEAAIPSDTPSTGYIRVVDNNGFERRLHYTAWSDSTDTFTVDTTDGNEDFNTVNANGGNEVYIAYIDKLADATTASFTSVQSGSRDLVVLVRDGGTTSIKQFISSWSQTAAAGSITAIRTSDM